MNSGKKLKLLLIASSIFLAACNMHAMSGPGKDLEDAVKSGNWQHASRIYNSNHSFFQGKEDFFLDQYDLIAAGLNQNYYQRLSKQLNSIENIQWPSDRRSWTRIKRELKTARSVLGGYDSHKLLQTPEYRLADADRLATALNNLEGEIAISAPSAFADFNHFRGQSFFELYPINLKKSRFMTRYFATIQNDVKTARLVDLDRFLSSYPIGDVLIGNAAATTQKHYMRALTLKHTAGREPDLLDSWSVLEDARKNGIDVDEMANGRFVVVEIPSDERVGERGIEYAVQLKPMKGFELRRADIEDALTDPVSEQADYAIIVDLQSADSSMTMTSSKNIRSRYYTHSTYSTNPAFTAAQREVREARRALRQAHQDADRRKRINRDLGGNSDAGALASVLGDILSSASSHSQIMAAEERLEAAEEKLQKTPAQIEQKQYARYRFKQVGVDVRKNHRLNYMVIDRSAGKYVRGILDLAESKTFQMLQDTRPGDPNVEGYRKNAVSEEDVQDWLEKPVTVSIAKIVADYKKRRFRAARLPALALVQQDLFDQRNQSLQQVAKGQAKAVTGTASSHASAGLGRTQAVTGDDGHQETSVGFSHKTNYRFPVGRSNNDAYAVVIGVKDYDDRDIPQVDYALNDAEAIRQYLIKSRGFQPENVLVLENPNQSQLLAQFGTAANPRGKLYDTVQREGIREVFVFFSGHGIPTHDGTAVIMPSDGDPLKPEFTGYGLDVLIGNLNKLRNVQVTLAVDSCFSGISAGGSLIREASPVFLSAQAAKTGLDNGVVFTAADGSEIASWDRSVRLGLFTRHLLEGFIGKADNYGDGNGTVEVYEMDRYLREAVGKDANRRFSRRQTPQTLGDPQRTVNSATDAKIASIEQVMKIAN